MQRSHSVLCLVPRRSFSIVDELSDLDVVAKCACFEYSGITKYECMYSQVPRNFLATSTHLDADGQI